MESDLGDPSKMFKREFCWSGESKSELLPCHGVLLCCMESPAPPTAHMVLLTWVLQLATNWRIQVDWTCLMRGKLRDIHLLKPFICDTTPDGCMTALKAGEFWQGGTSYSQSEVLCYLMFTYFSKRSPKGHGMSQNRPRSQNYPHYFYVALRKYPKPQGYVEMREGGFVIPVTQHNYYPL